MIHPNAQINWIDTASGDGMHTTSVETLFSKFIARSAIIDAGVRAVYFSDRGRIPDIYIQDMTGYTPINSIGRSPAPGCWLKIHNAGDLEVTLDSIIPVYDIAEQPYLGFHGEMKRKYTLKTPEYITETDFIRIYNPDSKLEDYIKPDIEVCNSGCSDYGYFIVTNSRFCTINGVHLYSTNEIQYNTVKNDCI